MLTFIQKYNIIRWLYAIAGLGIFFSALNEKKYLEMIFGLYFASMGIFNYGCAAGICGTTKPNIPNLKNKEIDNNKITFEEIK